MRIVRNFRLESTSVLPRELNKITRDLCEYMNVARCSVWVFEDSEDNPHIECVSLFNLHGKSFEEGK